MRKGSQTYAAYLAPMALCLATGLATGCSKKDKSDDDSSSAAPDTYVVDSTIDNGTASFKYKSTDAAAKFKCSLGAGPAEAASAAWLDCPAEGWSSPVETNTAYTFLVKSVSASGVEDAEPASYAFRVGGDAGKDEGPTTLILNRADVGETYTQAELSLEFGVEGGPSVDDVRFECKRENENSYRRCPDGSSYKFDALKDGYIYSLAVRAVNRNDGSIAKEDVLTFRVELKGLDIGGKDQLQQNVTGQVTLTFPAGAQCAVDGGQPQPCVPTFSNINLNDQQITQGNHTLVVTVDGGGREEINFCARVCAGEGVRPAQPIIQDFQLGSFYTYRIPEGMHVVNYATSKTLGDSVFWLRATEDPMANDLDACLNNDFPQPVPGREFSMLTPSGRTMKYCATTPTRETYKLKTEHRRALNHLEVSTDVELVMNGTQVRDERILFNVFDNDVEWMVSDTTFQRLCRNRNGRLFETPPLRVMERDYFMDPVHTSLMMCLADMVEFIQDPNGMVTPVSARWWVGSFFISSDGIELPAIRCMDSTYPGYDQNFCDGYWDRRQQAVFANNCRNPSLVEATIMVRQDSRYGNGPRSVISDEVDFARVAQRFFIDNLGEIVPVAN